MVRRNPIPLFLIFLLSACTGTPEGVEPVRNFEADRYLGKWYEIARLDHSFEAGLSRVTARYSRRADWGIRVINRGYDAEAGEWREAEGRAYFTRSPDIGALKVSFFGPFYAGYNVIALDKDNYQWAIVCGYNREYLWILSRTPTLAPARLDALLERARELDFPVDQLIFVEHQPPA
jgi:apolipoprotein D and lipocalin family protein